MTLRSFLLLLLLSLGALTPAQGFYQNRWADVGIVSRDYGGNLTASDRNWFYRNADGSAKPEGGGVCPSVEFDLDSSATHTATGQVGVVFTRTASSTTIAVTFRNDNDFKLSGTLRFISARLTEPDASGNEDAVSVPLTVSPTGAQPISLGANGGHATFSVTVSGLPSSVALGRLALNYDLPLHDEDGTTGNNGSQGNYEPWEKLYIVDQAPVGLQAVPWTDFLESTCRWAFGAAGQADMKQKMTYGMFYNTRSPLHTILYDFAQRSHYLVTTQPPTANPPFRLKKFVQELAAGNPQTMTTLYLQCSDYGSILSLAFASQGYDAKAIAYYGSDDGNTINFNIGFYTNPLCSNQFNYNDKSQYSSARFFFHVIAGDSLAGADERFDASNCYEYEYSQGALYLKPVVAWLYPGFLYGANINRHGLIRSFFLHDPSTDSDTSINYGKTVPLDYTPLALTTN